MINFRSRKADITANQIITIVILIVSFAVILMFFFMLNIKGNVDAESCKNSIALKAIPVFGRAISLRCQTQDICLSMGGNCEGMKTGTQTIKVKSGDYIALYGKLAELHRDCFWMMGEGQVDIGSRICAVCNVISFDETIKQKGIFSQEDYMKYLEEHSVPGKDISYLYYFYQQHFWATFKGILIQNKVLTTSEIPPFDPAKKYFVWFATNEKGYGNGISPFDSDYIQKLECKDFATLR
jgi:hypothetical protein